MSTKLFLVNPLMTLNTNIINSYLTILSTHRNLASYNELDGVSRGSPKAALSALCCNTRSFSNLLVLAPHHAGAAYVRCEWMYEMGVLGVFDLVCLKWAAKYCP